MHRFWEDIQKICEEIGLSKFTVMIIASFFIAVIFCIIISLLLSVINQCRYNKNKKELYAFLADINYFSTMNQQFDSAFGSPELYVNYEKSSQMVSNFASHKRMDYLVKYFGFSINTESLKSIQCIYDTQKKVEDYVKDSPLKKRILINDVTPCFSMTYISPSGRKTRTSYFDFTVNEVARLYDDSKNLLSKQKSTKYQRSAMTSQIRESVLQRDNWTCQKCGNSVYREPNLLLEVDHIIPISKGGKTEPNNLQTLCWRCNRSKSDKL